MLEKEYEQFLHNIGILGEISWRIEEDVGRKEARVMHHREESKKMNSLLIESVDRIKCILSINVIVSIAILIVLILEF
jgi:hypothetical protein